MQRKFLTGIMLGAVATMLVMPEIDRGTKRRIKRTAKNVRCAAEDVYDNMKRMIN